MNNTLYPYLQKNDKQRFINVQFLSIFSLCFIVAPVLIVNWFISGVADANERTSARVAMEQEQMMLSTMVPAMLTQMYTPPAPTNTPIYASPTAEPTPTGTAMPDLLPRLTFALSFYDPAIGRIFPDIASVNCLEWSVELQDCLSKVNNGRDHYSTWYRRGAACGDPLHIGQRFRVVSPEELRAINPDVWTCVDRGGAITPGFLDFMLRYPDDLSHWSGADLNNFPWAYHAGGVVVELLP